MSVWSIKAWDVMSVDKLPKRSAFFEYMYSYISRRFFLNTCIKLGITPNQLTVFSGFCGIIGAVFVASSMPLMAFIFINLYSILDLVDGDIARHRNMQTSFGYWLDIFFDKLIDALLIISLSYLVFQHTGDASSIFLGMVAMASIFFNQMVLILNDTIFLPARDKNAYKKFVNTELKNLNVKGQITHLARKLKMHFSLNHNAFLFLLPVYLLTLSPTTALLLIVVHALLTLALNVISNFIAFRGL
jgi:phosphatidylglycerophosphate synthase